MVRVGHDGNPGPSCRRAREGPLVHVTVAVRSRPVGAPVAARRVPVMLEPHVMSQLVRERNATAIVTGEAKGVIGARREARDAAHARRISNQVDEVRSDPVAYRVDLVHVTVRAPDETVKIPIVVCLRVLHLFPGRQHNPLVHAAVPVGLVRLGDHEVDHRLDRRRPPLPPARRRRIEDRHVYRGNPGRRHPAREPRRVEPGRGRPGLEGRVRRGHAELGEVQVHPTQGRLQRQRERSGQVDVERQVQPPEVRQVVQFSRNRSR